MKRAATPVAAAAAELDQIATLAASDIEPQILERIRELIDVTSDRAEIDPTWCVIGMLGGTGAGKSSLVNALAGGEVVCAGVLRPTTNEACAVLPAGREPKELLGWLGVRTRVCAPGDLPGDTAIIDLPDIDSVEASHAQVAGRLATRVDALVVVVNPQKYADARLHDEWLERLRTSHASVTVALTHIDTLGVAERTSIVSDLRRILDAPELHAFVLPSSEFLVDHSLQAFDDDGNLIDSGQVAKLDSLFRSFLEFAQASKAVTPRAYEKEEMKRYVYVSDPDSPVYGR